MKLFTFLDDDGYHPALWETNVGGHISVGDTLDTELFAGYTMCNAGYETSQDIFSAYQFQATAQYLIEVDADVKTETYLSGNPRRSLQSVKILHIYDTGIADDTLRAAIINRAPEKFIVRPALRTWSGIVLLALLEGSKFLSPSSVEDLKDLYLTHLVSLETLQFIEYPDSDDEDEEEDE